jgi:hypothetical protein
MHDKKDFNLLARQLMAFVDLAKWAASFGTDSIEQMITPVKGIRLSPELSKHFGVAEDEVGWMLLAHEREGKWLADLPVSSAFLDYTDGIVLLTDQVSVFDTPFESMGIDLFVPSVGLRQSLRTHQLLGFGLVDDAGKVTRVNRIVPMYTKERYEAQRALQSGNSTSIFRS